MEAPNIVLILVDDLGWRDLSCYGSAFYETPRIDALAARGLRYRNAYAAAPVCSPTRASIMSGKYPARVGVTQYIGGNAVGCLSDVPYFQQLPENEFSVARALKEAGYSTWHVGKWHLGPIRCWPERHGFDVNIGGCQIGAPSRYTSPYAIPTLDDGPDGEYLTDRLTNDAIRLIREAEDKPFFLNLWHYAVHIPIQAPESLVQKYERKAADLGLEIAAMEVGEPMSAWHLRRERVTRRTIQSDPHYAAMIENLDWNVGRLIDALDEAGKTENTILIFTSDNGGLATAEGSPTTNSPLAEGKGWMKDGGVRVPFILRWPGHAAEGLWTEALLTSPDLYPTLLAASGQQPRPHQHIDGANVLEHWMTGTGERGPIYWHYPHYSNQGGTPGAAVRDGNLKLIRYYESGRQELYDLAADIEERIDISGRCGDDMLRLTGLLDRWIYDVGALIPRPNVYAGGFGK